MEGRDGSVERKTSQVSCEAGGGCSSIADALGWRRGMLRGLL